MKVSVCYSIMVDCEIPENEVTEIMELPECHDNVTRGDKFQSAILEYNPDVAKIFEFCDGEITGVYNPCSLNKETMEIEFTNKNFDEAIWEA